MYIKCINCLLQLSILVHPDKNESDRERAQLAFDGMLHLNTAVKTSCNGVTCHNISCYYSGAQGIQDARG